ncbi:kynurenine/alpha-aminoadipate aminotransferase, mitochondrial [Pieris brassicae]|uniref:kynurenine/alpha-aminoadipate aminotransferase, mitochondrial n=1 Tax=Pieris brassicae TaxID=7116 RepID=UPI001E660D22|nr:kynurenine/alpha-aminoadipate aminotransferase, mitochondrial [Pieris brassicae]
MLSSMKINGELLKKVLDSRPIYSLLRNYSQNVEDILRLDGNGEEKYNFKEKYRVLDEKDYARFFSKRSLKREPALTRSLTSMVYKIGKQMISLAEGMPNEGIFPFDRMQMTMKNGNKLVLEENELAMALQYLPSQGLPSLLKLLRELQEDLHRPPSLDRDVLITNGAQHGIYQCIDMLVDPGDPVITTEYTFTGYNSALRPYDPEVLRIPEDEDGLIPETLEAVLEERLSRGLIMPRVLYLIPTGNNPTGTIIPAARRRKIYELACRYDFLIIEDDPYAFLNYSNVKPPSFLSMDQCGRVIRLDSVSKVVCAGLRGAWMTAPAPFIERAERHSQAELLHPCTLSQVIIQRLLSERSDLAAHFHSARSFYEQRCGALGDALRGLSHLAQWSRPKAGLFYWLKLQGVSDVYNMTFHTALEHGLMLCPGQAFQYDHSAPSQHLRLTFTRIKLEDINTAVRRLADVIDIEQKMELERLPQRFATER